MKKAATIAAFALVLSLGGMLSEAHAQYKGKPRPFENYARSPSVSPYMNLINNNNGTATNYQSLVRPQLDQQNYNRQATSAIRNLQSQVGDKQRNASTSEGNVKMRSTGHVATRGNYSHFYPTLNGR